MVNVNYSNSSSCSSAIKQEDDSLLQHIKIEGNLLDESIEDKLNCAMLNSFKSKIENYNFKPPKMTDEPFTITNSFCDIKPIYRDKSQLMAQHILSAVESDLSMGKNNNGEESDGDMRVTLDDRDLWVRFQQLTNEMIVTKNGR